MNLLEQIAKSEHPVSLATLAETTGLPKPSALRILSRLVDTGMLLREPASKSYISGPRLVNLACDTLLNAQRTAHSAADRSPFAAFEAAYGWLPRMQQAARALTATYVV